MATNEDPVKCNICERTFSKIGNLTRHKKDVHKIEIPVKTNIECLDCPSIRLFTTIKKFREHLQSEHSLDMKEETMSFQSEEDFKKWKSEIEKNTNSYYKLRNGVYKQSVYKDGSEIYNYICNRSGTFMSRGTGQRALKSQGSCRMGICCTAFMKVVNNGKELLVNFGNQHYGHSTELEHLRLSPSDRCAIASKLQKGMTIESVLEDVKNSLKEGNSTRIHLLTRKDLYNVIRDFKLSLQDTSLNDVDTIHLPDQDTSITDIADDQYLNKSTICNDPYSEESIQEINDFKQSQDKPEDSVDIAIEKAHSIIANLKENKTHFSDEISKDILEKLDDLVQITDFKEKKPEETIMKQCNKKLQLGKLKSKTRRKMDVSCLRKSASFEKKKIINFRNSRTKKQLHLKEFKHINFDHHYC